MSLGVRYRAAGWALVAAFVALGSGHLLRSHSWGVGMRLVLSLAPVLPMARYCVLAVRIIRGFDELESRIHLEGALSGLLGTAILTMSGGLLMKGDVIPSSTLAEAWPWLWITAFLMWGLGSFLAGRRYR